MTRSLLTQKQLEVLETVISRYGNLVTYDQIAPLIPLSDDQGKRRFISQLARIGWLVRIKKGVYQVADLTSLGTLTLSRYVIAGLLAPDSYVSFESALQFHGLHDQLMQTTTSVSLKQHAAVTLGGYRYQYVKTADKYFFGFEEHVLDGQTAKIATVEKALIDMVQLHRTAHTVDRVAEVLADESADLDIGRLQTLLRQATLTTQRVFGLLFDKLGLSYEQDLVERSRESLAASKITAASQDFDAKWRLYYDADIVNRYATT